MVDTSGTMTTLTWWLWLCPAAAVSPLCIAGGGSGCGWSSGGWHLPLPGAQGYKVGSWDCQGAAWHSEQSMWEHS
jgi:hypothetical protein